MLDYKKFRESFSSSLGKYMAWALIAAVLYDVHLALGGSPMVISGIP